MFINAGHHAVSYPACNAAKYRAANSVNDKELDNIQKAYAAAMAPCCGLSRTREHNSLRPRMITRSPHSDGNDNRKDHNTDAVIKQAFARNFGF